MSKILLAILTCAAFLYAAWLVLLRRQLPDPRRSAGLRRRFILATLLFVGLLGVSTNTGCCYMPGPPEQIRHRVTLKEVSGTLQGVWWTLDTECEEDFRDELEKVVSQNQIRRPTADMLATAFTQLAYHKKRKRTCCYVMAGPGLRIKNVRENATKQLELLEKAAESGTIDATTKARVRIALARELEMLYHLRPGGGAQDKAVLAELVKQYESGEIVVSGAASTAAEIIVEMET